MREILFSSFSVSLLFILFLCLSLVSNFNGAKSESNLIYSTRTSRKYQRKNGELKMSQGVFEYYLSTNTLLSENQKIQLPPSYSKRIISSERIPYTVDGIRQADLDSSSIVSYSITGHTFIFDSHDNKTLIHAWGPALDLHPIESVNGNARFINRLDSFQTVERSTLNDNSNPYIPQNCDKFYTFELAVGYDASFCDQHQKNHAKATENIKKFIARSSVLFMQTACVKVKVVRVDARCHDRKYERPWKCKENSTEPCERSKIMLRQLSKEWNSNPSVGTHRDAAVFFSGYTDGTSLAGATYRAQICNQELSFAWIEGSVSVVFEHEIGHMLGAKHAKEGIMTPRVSPDKHPIFSRNSQLEMIRFIQKDSRSWCLRRDRTSILQDLNKYKWSYANSIVNDPGSNVNVSDVTFAALSEHGKKKDIISLISQRLDGGGVKINYRVKLGISCSDDSTCTSGKDPNPNEKILSLGNIEFPKHSYGFGISFANLLTRNSKDVIVSYFEGVKLSSGKIKAVPFFKIGYEMGSNGSAPLWWGEKKRMYKFAAEKVECASINVGHVRSPEKLDLILVYIDRKQRRNVMMYKFGFDLTKYGRPRDGSNGWTEGIEVPGYFGKDTTSVSAAIVDVDKNGIPDLVLYHADNTPSFKVGYIRVGKDLNSTGHVTGGWTDFIRAPVLIEDINRRAGAMDVSTDIKTGQPIVASIQRQNMNFYYDWTMFLGSEVLTQKLMSTSRERPLLQDLSEGCDRCYPGRSSQCKEDLSRCKSKIDEVSIAKTNIATRMNAVPSPSDSSMDEDFEDDAHDGEYENDPSRPQQPEEDSVYCTGFHYFYTKRGGCDVIDKETVLAKGLEEYFLRLLSELKEIDFEDIEESSSLFEDPSGIYGNGRPIVVQATIRNKKDSYKKAIEKAFSILRTKKGFSSVFKPSMNIEKRAYYNNKKNVWVVKFFFDTKE